MIDPTVVRPGYSKRRLRHWTKVDIENAVQQSLKAGESIQSIMQRLEYDIKFRGLR